VTTSDLARCKAVGMNDYISKPVDERLLYSKIAGFLKKPALTKNTTRKALENQDDKRPQLTNLEYLNHLTKSNPKLMTEMLTLYLEQTTGLIATMKQSLHDQDWHTLQAIAHKLIPSFSIVGISVDHENLAKKIQEDASKQQSTEAMPALVLQLTNTLAQACEELAEDLALIKNPA
jgi:HPt (histidine-containing phosphotransfer) domain-containing protein